MVQAEPVAKLVAHYRGQVVIRMLGVRRVEIIVVVDGGGAADDELVRQARAGDRASFAHLFQRHTRRVFRIAVAILQNQSDADDVVQETFLAAFRGIRHLKKEESFNSWLGRIAVNKARDLSRQRQRQRRVTSYEAHTPSPEKMAVQDNSVAGSEQAMDVRRAIDRLPEMHRVVVLLYYGEEMTTEEVARTLGRPPGTVRRILSEAYQRLRRELGQDI